MWKNSRACLSNGDPVGEVSIRGGNYGSRMALGNCRKAGWACLGIKRPKKSKRIASKIVSGAGFHERCWPRRGVRGEPLVKMALR